MLESERKVFEKMDGKSPMSKYWMPLVWATNIINRARKEGLITSDHIVQTLLVELSDIRRRLGALIGYDTVCVPLVYTQASSFFFFFLLFYSALRTHIPPKCQNMKYSKMELYRQELPFFHFINNNLLGNFFAPDGQLHYFFYFLFNF